MKKLLLVVVVCIGIFSFAPENSRKKPHVKSYAGITCRQWCSHENTWADMANLAAWDAQMSNTSPDPREQNIWEVGCGVGSEPGCVMGTCIQICYGSFP